MSKLIGKRIESFFKPHNINSKPPWRSNNFTVDLNLSKSNKKYTASEVFKNLYMIGHIIKYFKITGICMYIKTKTSIKYAEIITKYLYRKNLSCRKSN